MNDDELNIRFLPPNTSVVSVRLNREEMRVLTEGARFYGVKLSTYIKRAAIAEASLPMVRFDTEPA